MPHQTESEIIDDILNYLREHESVCIQTERQSGPGWIREHDEKWQFVKYTSQDSLSSSTLEEETVKAILKANYYRLIPTPQARTETGESVWSANGDTE